MGGGRVVVPGVEVGTQLRSRTIGEVADHLPNVLHGVVEAGDVGVHLHPLACRQDNRFAHIPRIGEAGQHLGQVVGRDGQRLEELERRAAMVDPEGENGHGGTTSLGVLRSGRLLLEALVQQQPMVFRGHILLWKPQLY